MRWRGGRGSTRRWLSGAAGFVAGKLTVRPLYHAEQDREDQNCATKKSCHRRTVVVAAVPTVPVAMCVVSMRVSHARSVSGQDLAASFVTRTEVILSSPLICFIASRPSITRPNTVCTPFRCLVFASLRTMKN